MASDREHHVYFAVFGFAEDPGLIGQLLGVDADETWRQGDAFSDAEPDARRLENRWILSSLLDETASHRAHFEILATKLENLGTRLQALRSQYRCGIGVSRYYFMDDPEFYLPAELLERFRALGIGLSFDQLGLDTVVEPADSSRHGMSAEFVSGMTVEEAFPDDQHAWLTHSSE